MPRQAEARSYGSVFDDVAEDYDRHRPTYPDVLVDRACEGAGIGPGAAVLEVGCGTGQLTRSLLARGLRVTAVEPGRQLIARARKQVNGVGDLQFVNARFEDTSLPGAQYSAVFSASAIHWIDPDVSWRKAADALVDGGSLALVSYFGLDGPRSANDQQTLRATMATTAPELATDWPTYRHLTRTLAGVAARRNNVSDVWAWLGGYEIARGYAADLFDDADIAAVPMLLEHTADELNALLGTIVTPTARRSRRRTPNPSRTARPADPLGHGRLPGSGTAPAPHLTSCSDQTTRSKQDAVTPIVAQTAVSENVVGRGPGSCRCRVRI